MGDLKPGDELPDLLAGAVRGLDPPPPAPREEMWQRIAARRRKRPVRLRAEGWVAAVAAVLVLGIGIARFVRLPDTQQPAPAPPTNAPQPATPADSDLATQRHLTTTEAFLAAFPGVARSGPIDPVTERAHDLLTDTRVIAVTAEGRDIARLLDDLELALARIAALPAQPSAAELDLIENGIHRSHVLQRVRAFTLGPAAGT